MKEATMQERKDWKNKETDNSTSDEEWCDWSVLIYYRGDKRGWRIKGHCGFLFKFVLKISHGFTSMYFIELAGIFLSLSFSGLFTTFLLL